MANPDHSYDATLRREAILGDAGGLGDSGAGRVELDGSWRIGEAINGGLLMAVATRALADRALAEGGHGDPLSVSAYFLSATLPGEALVTTELIRVGRLMSTGQVSLSQPAAAGPDGPDGPDGTPQPVERLRALATFGDLGDDSPPLRTPTAPVIPPPQECIPADQAPEHVRPPILEHLDLRLDPDSVGWAFGSPSKRGRMLGWLRFRDGRAMDPVSLVFALDAMPPVSFDLGIPGWAPTLELSAHIRARPQPGWVLVEVRTETLAGSLLEEDARIWDSSGRLVAQSRQLASVRLPS